MSYDDMTGFRSIVEPLAEFLYLRQSGMGAAAWSGIGGGCREVWREEARRVMDGSRPFPVTPGGIQETMEG